MGFIKAIFGNYSKKELKRVKPIMNSVLALEDKYKAMTDAELKDQTNVLKPDQCSERKACQRRNNR